MPVTPPQTSARLKIHYNGPYGDHVMLIRGGTDTSESTMVEMAMDLVGVMKVLNYNTVVYGSVEYAPAGQTFFNEVTGWTPVTAGGASGPASSDVPSRFLNFCGRSPSTGKRTKIYLFETYVNGDNSMRLSIAESVPISNVVDVLNDSANFFCAVDGTPCNWKAYANAGQNDYLTHRARRT